ncbi:pms1 DNA mismatch repair protein pms1 [Candida maltosa Xu316]
MSSSSIRNISNADISKITSAQVIIDLKSIVKELIENSIDAGADKIDISFTNYGIDSIQVQDNGKGISQEDFESVCLRGHTSKIEIFEDLDKLSTLGFRGEALNSICSMANNVTIITTTPAIYPKCHVLNYDQMGKLVKQTTKVGAMNYKSGSLIQIEGLFKNVPVRLKNFIKNSKREFHKAINFIINYLIIFPKIKFTVHNNANNKKNLMLSSKGGDKTTIIDNLISVFGRSAPDRQFLYVNKRPIVFKKLSKLINEVYKSYNHVQYPIYVINIAIRSDLIDVNLTPDKTNILIHNESEILQSIREILETFFETQDNVIIPKNENSQFKPLSEPTKEPEKKEQKLFVDDDIDVSYEVSEYTGNANEEVVEPKQEEDETQPPPSNQEKESQPSPVASPVIKRTLGSSQSTIDAFAYPQEKENSVTIDKHGENFFPVSPEQNLSIGIGDQTYEEDHRSSKRSKKNNGSVLFKKKDTLSSADVQESLTCIPKIDDDESSIQTDDLKINKSLEATGIYSISKQDFLEMKIIGQFNLGFILVNHQSNLFIIDQHAADEKFNFEKLMTNFKIKHQPLMSPINLELNIIDEMLVLDHQQVFDNNGFKLTIYGDNPPGKKISLISLPTYQNTMFGLDDFHELINLINEQPNNKNLKISKIRKILAMRACRSSIMIGSALSMSKMNEVVKNLSTLDKPWNCPHGRPTMRHLTELPSSS